MKHPSDRAVSKYRYWLKKLRDLEARFDAFIRCHDDEAQRKAYAEKANAKYFAIKARLQRIKEEHQASRFLCSDC